MKIDFMVEAGSYGSDHFPIILKSVFHFRMHYPVGILIGLTGCNLINYVKKNCHWL